MKVCFFATIFTYDTIAPVKPNHFAGENLCSYLSSLSIREKMYQQRTFFYVTLIGTVFIVFLLGSRAKRFI